MSKRRITIGIVLACVLPSCESASEPSAPEEPGSDSALGRPTTGTVFRTDGIGLNVRAQPTTASAVIATVSEGAKVEIGCQISGESIAGTAIWDFLPAYGGYASDAFVYTGYDGFAPGIPKCKAPAVTDEEWKPPTDAGGKLVVRGVELEPEQAKWMRYIVEQVVPEMRGARSDRIGRAATVAWWSLKEGVLDLENPLAYSNCHFPPDEHIGPLDVCPNPDNAWQVGLSGVQAAWRTLDEVETLASDVHSEKSLGEVLIDAAERAGYSPSSSTGKAIAQSTGRLRLSWLLRDSAVGFEAQYPVVENECFVTCSAGWETPCAWCFGSGWPASESFAPDRPSSEKAVADIRAIFEDLAP